MHAASRGCEKWKKGTGLRMGTGSGPGSVPGDPNRFRGYIWGVNPNSHSFFPSLSLSTAPFLSLESVLPLFFILGLLMKIHQNLHLLWQGKPGSGGSWPAGAAAPPRRNPKVNFCFFFFGFFLLLSTSIRNTKIPKSNPKPPGSISQFERKEKKRKKKDYTLGKVSRLLVCDAVLFVTWCCRCTAVRVCGTVLWCLYGVCACVLGLDPCVVHGCVAAAVRDFLVLACVLRCCE